MPNTSIPLEPIAVNPRRRQSDHAEERQSQNFAQAQAHTAPDGVVAEPSEKAFRFWNRQISIVTGQEACRDHFGKSIQLSYLSPVPQTLIITIDPANERTFLGYLRTSSAFATLGVVSFQLFLLGGGRGAQTACRVRYGKILAVACEGFAIVVACSGAWRWWRQQSAILRGRAKVGGWEIHTIGVGGIGVGFYVYRGSVTVLMSLDLDSYPCFGPAVGL